MKLQLIDRCIIFYAGIFPLTGSFKQLTIRKDILEKVKITQDDFVKYEITESEDKSLKWNSLGSNDYIEFNFTDLEKDEIKLSLEIMNKDKKLTTDHYSLCELFKIE